MSINKFVHFVHSLRFTLIIGKRHGAVVGLGLLHCVEFCGHVFSQIADGGVVNYSLANDPVKPRRRTISGKKFWHGEGFYWAQNLHNRSSETSTIVSLSCSTQLTLTSTQSFPHEGRPKHSRTV